MSKTIYDLGLHETVFIKELKVNVTRVAGGWLYAYEKAVFGNLNNYLRMEIDKVVFVPYNNDFQESSNLK